MGEGDATGRSMGEEEKLAWRRREIVTLLGYPKVGPLTAAAIRINLGAGEEEIGEALRRLTAEGAVIEAGEVQLPALHQGRPGSETETLYTIRDGRAEKRT